MTMRWVTTTYPVPGYIGFPVDDAITIRFHVDLKKSSLSGKTIQLWNLDEQLKVAIVLEDHMYDSIRRTLTIRPVLQLQAETRYRLLILGAKDGIVNIIDEEMEETYSLEFLTGNRYSIKKPHWIHPASESVVLAPFQLRWGYGDYDGDSENTADMNAECFEIQIARSSDFLNVVWPQNYEVIYGFDVTPHLTENGQYFIRIRALDQSFHKGPFSDVLIVHVTSQFLNQNEENQPIDPQNPTNQFPFGIVSTTIRQDALRVPQKTTQFAIRFTNAIQFNETMSNFNETMSNGFYEKIKWFESQL